MIRFLLLFISIFTCNPTGYASGWVKIYEDNIRTSYVDIDRLEKQKQSVVFWSLIDYKNNNISSISKHRAFCGEGKKIHLYFSYYNQPMGSGRIVGQDNWTKTYNPKPGTLKHEMMKFACNKAR